MSRFIAASDSVLNDLNQTSDYPASDCTDNTRLVYHIQLIEIANFAKKYFIVTK